MEDSPTLFDQSDSSTEFSGFSANSYLTPSSPNMTTGVTPETSKSVSITENCYSHTIRLDSKLLPEISKSIIDIHESNVVTKNGGNGEIHNFNIQNQEVYVTLYLNGTIHVQGPAHKLWVQTNLLVILESCKNKLEEIESPKNKTSGFWKKIANHHFVRSHLPSIPYRYAWTQMRRTLSGNILYLNHLLLKYQSRKF